MTKTTWVKPQDVLAPKASWLLVRVIIDGGPEEPVWAVGYWKGQPSIASRWNGHNDKPLGMPCSRGAVWFLIEDGPYEALFDYLAERNPSQAAFLAEFRLEWRAKRAKRAA